MYVCMYLYRGRERGCEQSVTQIKMLVSLQMTAHKPKGERSRGFDGSDNDFFSI